MADSIRTVNAEVNLKGTASSQLKDLNEQLDESEQGFTSLTDEANKLIAAQTEGAGSTSVWGLAFKAFSAFGVVDLFAEMAFGAFAYAYSADDAALSTTGWMAELQKFVAGVIEPFVEIIRDLVEAFMEFKKWLLETEEGMRLIYATLIALSPLIGYFLVLGVWTLVSATYAWVAANWALILSYAPLILLWLGIAAVIGAVVLVIEDFLTWMEGGESFFGDWFGEWQGWGHAFSSIWDGMKNVAGNSWTWIKEKFAAGWKWLKSLFINDKGSFSEIFFSLARNIYDIFFNTWQWLKDLWNGTGTSIKGPIGDAINWIRTTLHETWEWLRTKFWELSDFIANEYPEVGQFIHDYIVAPLNVVLGVLQKILSFLGIFSEKFKDAAAVIGTAADGLDKFGQKRGLTPGQSGPMAPELVNASYQPKLKFDGARAGGGDVAAGGTYLVGEQGPEVLQMGGGSGRVIPNHSLGSKRLSLSIGAINITVTGNAVRDTIVSQVKEAIDILSREEFAVEAGLA